MRPVEKNLKSLITINDKFVLINELFDGNLREYNESIETLNGFKDLRPALDYLDLLEIKTSGKPPPGHLLHSGNCSKKVCLILSLTDLFDDPEDLIDLTGRDKTHPYGLKSAIPRKYPL